MKYLNLLPLVALALAGCSGTEDTGATAATREAVPVAALELPSEVPTGSLTVYCGRKESLVGEILKRFNEETAIEVNIRYGDTPSLSDQIVTEGDRSPADLFFAQDAGNLGALAGKGRFQKLPAELLDRVEPRFRAPGADWIGISGRARVVVYNTITVKPADLPSSILGFTDPVWKGRIGWAPGNGSFQAHISAMRATMGEESTVDWLTGILANEPRVYPKNSPIVRAAADGDVDVGFVNHYYLYRFLAEEPQFAAANYAFPVEDIGNMINVAGLAVLDTSKNAAAAVHLIDWLLREEAQEYFGLRTHEYPAVPGTKRAPALIPLEEFRSPEIQQTDLVDVVGTRELLRDVGALK